MQKAIERYLSELQIERKASEHTVLAYRTDLDQFLHVIAVRSPILETPVALTAEMMETYANWLQAQGYKASTISRKMAAVRSFLQYAGGLGLISAPDAQRVLKAPPNPRHRPMTLSQPEIERLLAAPRGEGRPAGLRDAAILTLLYETAFRVAQVVRLRLSDLDLPHGRVRRPVEVETWVEIDQSREPLQAYLTRGRPYLLRSDGESALFLNQRGQALSRQGLWLVVKRWASAVGLGDHVSPYTLRHTRAQRLYEEGYSRKEIQKRLGLSSPNSLRVHRAIQS